MNYRRLWLRAFHRRLAMEWHRFGAVGPALARLAEIRRREGWRGVRARIASLTGVAAPAPHAATGRARRERDARPGVMLTGHPYGILGVGENLRASATALKAAGIPFHVRDTLDLALKGALPPGHLPLDGPIDDGTHRHRANLLVLNADEMDLAASHLGLDFFARSRNIGCWMWELSRFPGAWRPAFDWVHEVWAQSRFVEAALSPAAPVPVVWMPQAVEPGPADPQVARALGVPGDRYSFLFFFDFQSFVARKNPLAVIEAFEKAFPRPDDPACLVIKLHGAAFKPREAAEFAQAMAARRGRVVLVDRALSHAEMKGLISGCDAFVSLHRSEGFGRGLAEAMYYGKPAIATGYSGNLDFMTPQNSCLVDYRLVPVREGEYPFWQGQVWADPDVEQAARWMRQLREDAALRARLGARAAADIRKTHGAAAVGARMAARLRQLDCL